MTLAVAIVVAASTWVGQHTRAGNTLRVPDDYPSIQSAIDAAVSGDLVLVAPGTYAENVVISQKSITLASQFYETGDRSAIEATVIRASSGPIVRVNEAGTQGTVIVGFTIGPGRDGIDNRSTVEVLDNTISGVDDGVSFTNAHGVIRGNTLRGNLDDGIDFDRQSDGLIEDNLISGNGNDGIEIRLHDFEGPPLDIRIRSNVITGNLEDGIQLIDYPASTSRVFTIERNLISDNAEAGIGLMDGGISNEDFRGAPIPERIHVFDNTFVGNPYGLTGGANLIALNNIFTGSSVLAMKNVGGGSVAAWNLFWGNGDDHLDSQIDLTSTLFVDPMLGPDHAPIDGSPAVDAGTAQYDHAGELIVLWPPETFRGTAPDLGWLETSFVRPIASGPPSSSASAPLSSEPSVPPSAVPSPSASIPPDPPTAPPSAPPSPLPSAEPSASSQPPAPASPSPSASPSPIANRPPVMRSVTVTPGDPRTNSILDSTVDAADPDGDEVSFRHRWLRNGDEIAGETSSSLDLGAAGNGGRGDTIAVRVWPSDGAIEGDPMTSDPVTVGDTAPTAVVALSPSEPTTDATVTATVQADDEDGDLVNLHYEWTVNGDLRRTVDTTDPTDRFDLSVAGNGDDGDTIRSRVTPSDDLLTGDTTADAVVVGTSAPVVWARDRFARTITGGWGDADTGGRYALQGDGAAFSVDGSEGTMSGSAGKTIAATLTDVAATDVDVTFRFRIDRLPSGASLQISAILRRQTPSLAYLARVRITSSGRVFLGGIALDGGQRSIGKDVRVTAVAASPGAFIWVRARVEGSTPTTLRIRAWMDGTPEPGAWAYLESDETAGLQGPGAIGLRTKLGSKATNGPVVVGFDDLDASEAP